MDPRSSLNVRLNVKPIFLAMHHDYVYEGPCRFESGDELKTEYDLKVNEAAYRQFLDDLKAHAADHANLLKPVFIDRNEEFLIQEEQLAKMAEDDDVADAYLIGEKGRGYDMIVEFAQRCKKPILLAENALYMTITMAALLARGLEAYPALTWQDVSGKLDVLRVRKALRETRVLLAPKGNSNISLSTTDSFLSLERVTERLGVRFRYVDAHELLDQTRQADPCMNNTLPGRTALNPTKEDMEEIRKLTEGLVSGATECDMEKEDVLNSVKAYYTVKKLMAHHQCNAFSMPCPDVCATRRLNEEKITFCLTHSLNNEDGMPSACEYDIPALLSMIVLANFSRSAPYMGNTFPVYRKANGERANLLKRFFRAPDSQNVDIPDLKDLDNVILTFHSTPNRRLEGYDRPAAPYAIRSFARDGNWGATLRYDFRRDVGKTITMCRFDPACAKLFVAKGVIAGSVGYTDQNCSHGVFFTVNDDRDFFDKQVRFGNHVPLVYGDYFDQMKDLGAILGLEVVTA